LTEDIDRELDEVETLLRERLADIAAPDEVKAGVRAEFLAAARSRFPEKPVPRFSGLRARARLALAGGMAAVLMSGATVYAASEAMPGRPFYPVKRAVEQVELLMKRNEASRAKSELGLAKKRLGEIDFLVETQRESEIDEPLRAGRKNIRSATERLRSPEIDPDERRGIARELAGLKDAEKDILKRRLSETGRPAPKPLAPPAPAQPQGAPPRASGGQTDFEIQRRP
jgi:hypothetical protein